MSTSTVLIAEYWYLDKLALFGSNNVTSWYLRIRL